MEKIFYRVVQEGQSPFTNPEIASSYETWYETIGRRAVNQEKALLKRLFARFPNARTIARQGLILGVLNADSRLGRQYKREGGPIWEAARFFTPLELERIVFKIAGEKARIFWRTTLWPYWPGALPLSNRGFIGMAVEL